MEDIDCTLKNNYLPFSEIEFNSTGSYLDYGKGYESFFIHEDKENCSVDSCEILIRDYDGNCDSRLEGDDIKIGPAPKYVI